MNNIFIKQNKEHVKFHYDLFDRIILRFNKYTGVAFAFDEIDKVKDFDFLYRILEDIPHKTVFLITNVSEWIAKLDRRLISRLLLDRVEFKPYNFKETRGILYERRKHAFTLNAWDYDAFEMIVKKSFASKDIRVGLFLMKIAGEISESRGSEKIEVKDVEKALKKLEDVPRSIESFV